MAVLLNVAGESLTINFSVNNKLGVLRNQISRDATQDQPVLADFEDEVNTIFGGDVLNVSCDREQATESAKATIAASDILRRELVSVSGTFFDPDAPEVVETFYLSGISPLAGVSDVVNFVTTNLKLPGGGTISSEGVFVGAFKRVE